MSSQYRLVATAETPQQIADALNVRRQELCLTITDLDEILGLAPSYCSKLFAHGYRKNLGHLSLPVMLQALGCRLAIIADDGENALPKVTQRAMRERSCGPNKIEACQKFPRPAA